MATNGITTLGNRTFLFGASSGIDTSALIEAAYNQRKAEADKIDIQITKNTAKVSAYSSLQTLGSAVQTALSGLQKNYSVLSSESSFDARAGTLSSSSTTSPTSLVTVAIDPGTPLGNYELEVVAKAQAHRVGGNSTTTDKDADLNFAGTFDIGVAGGTADTVTVTADMSLSELAAAINDKSSTTGVTASVLKSSKSGYQLILTAADTNKQIEVTNVTGDDVLQNLGVTDGLGAFVNELQTAQGATIVLDNVTITRDDNDFSDLIDGISLNVLNAEPGTKLQLQVTHDTSSVKDDILNFVDTYNELRNFILSQQEISDGAVADDAVLFGDTLLKTMTSSIQSLLSGSYGTGGGNKETLAELGISMGSGGVLEVDETVLDDALLNNFDEVRGIFESSATVDNAEFRFVGNTSSTQNMSFAMDITYSGGAITGVSVGGDNTLFEVSGTLIKGKAGTIYEGLSFAYVGTSNATVNIDFSQGFADMFSNSMDSFTSVTSGILQTQKVSLEDQNDTLQARADRVTERAEEYRDKLIDKYAAFEAQIAASQTILAQIQAILDANNNSNN